MALTLDESKHAAELLEAGLDNVLHSVVTWRASTARGERPWQLFVVLRDTAPEALSLVANALGPFGEEARPVVARVDEVRRGADVMGLYLWQVRQDYRLLCGPDPIEDLRPSMGSLRLLLEFRLRRHQGVARQRFMATLEHPSARRRDLVRLWSRTRGLLQMVETILALSPLARDTYLLELDQQVVEASEGADVNAAYDAMLSLIERAVAEVDRY